MDAYHRLSVALVPVQYDFEGRKFFFAVREGKGRFASFAGIDFVFSSRVSLTTPLHLVLVQGAE
jgi:hypothetical protein